jgi:hypothetical protein
MMEVFRLTPSLLDLFQMAFNGSSSLKESTGEKAIVNEKIDVDDGSVDNVHAGLEFPTEEEIATLKRVSDKIPWAAYRMLLLNSPSMVPLRCSIVFSYRHSRVGGTILRLSISHKS